MVARTGEGTTHRHTHDTTTTREMKDEMRWGVAAAEKEDEATMRGNTHTM